MTRKRVSARWADIDRRDFIRFGGASLSAALLAACGSEGPERAQKLLDYAAKKNESVERLIFRHTSMDHAKANVRAAGSEFPSYFIADTVPTLDAGTVSLRIPPGTRSGRTLRVRGRGVQKRNSSGDLLVTVEVAVPAKLSDAATTALLSYAEATKGDDPRADLLGGRR